jgi:hypothetical protein
MRATCVSLNLTEAPIVGEAPGPRGEQPAAEHSALGDARQSEKASSSP